MQTGKYNKTAKHSFGYKRFLGQGMSDKKRG